MKPHVAFLATGAAQTAVLVNGHCVYWENPDKPDCDAYHEALSALEVARAIADAINVPLVELSIPRFAYDDVEAWYAKNFPVLHPELS